MAALTDLRHAVRSLIRSPGITIAVLLTLAIGVGSNAVVAGFIRGVYFRPLPFTSASQVVTLTPAADRAAGGRWSPAGYAALRADASALDALAAMRPYRAAVSLADITRWRSAADVTPQFFDVLRLREVAAGTLPATAQLERDAAPRVVISAVAWNEDFGHRADVIGLPIEVDGRMYSVVAVAPPEFDGLYFGQPIDVWIVRGESTFGASGPYASVLTAIARLRAGESIRDVEIPGAVVEPYALVDPAVRGRLGSLSLLLLLAAVLVLAMAAANVAALLLSLASARTHQLAVRVALGASRRQLTRLLLVETSVLAAAGGALGWLLSAWTTHLVPVLLFAEDADRLQFLPSASAIVFAVGVVAAVMVTSSLSPMVSVPLKDPAAITRRVHDQASGGGRRAREALVIAQTALSCFLLTSSAVLYVDVGHSLQADLGDRGLRTAVAPVRGAPPYFGAADAALRRLSDVLETGWVSTLPAGRPGQSTYRVELPTSAWRDVMIDAVVLAQEDLAGNRLAAAAGRLFSARDGPGACTAALVDRGAADELFDGDALGRSIADVQGQRIDIVGVLGPPRASAARRTRPTLYFYQPQMSSQSGDRGPLLYHVPVASPRQAVTMLSSVATGTYFNLMGLAPVGGRVFTAADDRSACGVAIVNADAANAYFAGNAVGGALVDDAGVRRAVVGVVPNDAFKTFAPPAEPTVFQPLAQSEVERMNLVARTTSVRPSTLASITSALHDVQGGAPLERAEPLAMYLGRARLASERIATMFVTVCGALALCLSLLGIYSALSDAVTRRTREFGLRAALGARARHIVGPIVRAAVRLALLGALVGTGVALALHRWLDPFAGTATPVVVTAAVWLGAPLGLVLVGVLGSVLPARRAVTTDPLVAMRGRT